jgi:hypothetical protein
LYTPLLSHIRATYPAHLTLLDLIATAIISNSTRKIRLLVFFELTLMRSAILYTKGQIIRPPKPGTSKSKQVAVRNRNPISDLGPRNIMSQSIVVLHL